MEDLKRVHRATWDASDYAAVSDAITDEFVPDHLLGRGRVERRHEVLDVATGTGNPRHRRPRRPRTARARGDDPVAAARSRRCVRARQPARPAAACLQPSRTGRRERSPRPSLAAATLLGVGTEVYPTLLAAGSDASSHISTHAVVGVYYFWRDFGFVLGALIAGVGAEATSPAKWFLNVAAVTGLSGFVVAATPWQPPLRPAINRPLKEVLDA